MQSPEECDGGKVSPVSSPNRKHTSFDLENDVDEEGDFAKKPISRLKRKKSTIHDYVSTSGYYTCISKEPLPVRWNMEEDSPAGICFEAGNVVRMRSFIYVEPYLWAEILSGGFVCAGVGDSRREAAGTLLEEYFEPYTLPSVGEPTEACKEVEGALRKLERKSLKEGLPISMAELQVKTDGDSASSGSGSRRGSKGQCCDSSSSSEEEDDGMADKILELFHRFDINRDGTIELDELANVLQALDGKKWTQSKVANLLSKMDTDKDRRISYEEFVDWICGSCRWRKERREFFKTLAVQTVELEKMSEAAGGRRRSIRGSITMWQ